MSNLRIRHKKLDKQNLEIKNIINLYNTRNFFMSLRRLQNYQIFDGTRWILHL